MKKLSSLAIIVFGCFATGLILAVEASKTTCDGRCLEHYVDNVQCYCDYKCREYDNCCANYIDLCLNTTERTISCYARCYEPLTIKIKGDCDCDNDCSARGTCCDDYTPLCASENMCFKRCGTPRNDSALQCQCDSACKTKNGCCKGYISSCEAPDTTPKTTIACPIVMTTSGADSLLWHKCLWLIGSALTFLHLQI